MSDEDNTRAWYDRLVVALPERDWRLAGAVWFAVALSARIGQGWSTVTSPIFWLETAVPAAILAAYVTRAPAAKPARGFAAVVVPFLAAGTPFLFLVPDVTPWGRAHLALFGMLLAPPTLLMIWAYVVLRRSYALMAEARGLVTRGPYAWVRHPVYVAQFACGAIVVAFRFHPVSVVTFVAFVMMQRARARAEEAALAEAHPEEWAAYAAEVDRWWPRLTRSGSPTVQ